jgi:hypothetical protein
LTPARAVASATLAVGVLDGLDAIVFFGLRSGAGPVRIFQSIAAGLVGRSAASQGGLKTASLGLLLHFVVAFLIVLVFVVASRRVTILTRHAVAAGILYGVAAYFVMNRVVLPLSAIGSAGPFSWPVFANGLLIHAFGVGLPAALFARSADRGMRR